jgi:hypothetical protein
MQMASQELGNDYNIELHRLSMLQDEMARLDDMISNWHQTETELVGTQGTQRLAVLRYNLDVEKEKNDVANDTADNRRESYKMAVGETAVPSATSRKIAEIADPQAYQGQIDGVSLVNAVAGGADWSDLRGLENPVQRQRAAIDLKEAMEAKLTSTPDWAARTDAEKRTDMTAISRFVIDQTGVAENQLTQRSWAANRNQFLETLTNKFGYGGTTRNLVEAEMPGEATDAEVVQQRSEILKKWMDRRNELAEQMQETPSAPRYEDVRRRAREMYDPTSSAREAREQYSQLQEQRAAEEQARQAIRAAPKDQRILMKAIREAQRSLPGETALEQTTGPHSFDVNMQELDAVSFIHSSMQDGTLTMDRLIPYATSIAEAEHLDGSPEDIVAARDRILAGAMQSLYRNYQSTLPSNDLAPQNAATEPPPQPPKPKKTPVRDFFSGFDLFGSTEEVPTGEDPQELRSGMDPDPLRTGRF